jgi:hypothetical protein
VRILGRRDGELDDAEASEAQRAAREAELRRARVRAARGHSRWPPAGALRGFARYAGAPLEASENAPSRFIGGLYRHTGRPEETSGVDPDFDPAGMPDENGPQTAYSSRPGRYAG